jgi:hypothetical protein
LNTNKFINMHYLILVTRKPPVVAGDHLQVDTGIFVELVQTIGIPNLCGDFFVSLLNEYFSLQSASARSAEPKV